MSSAEPESPKFFHLFLRGARVHSISFAGLFALALASIGHPLVDSSVVLSSPTGDVATQFLYTRAFATYEILGGSFPLWNPFLYSGVPFFGDFQSALLYPPNLIFLFLPLSLAIAWSFALHVFIFGACMYAWACGRGLSRLPAFIAGAAAMFGAGFFLHIHAGHLSNICTMAWAPLVFLGMDRWMQTRRFAWALLAAASAALQVFAGHIQYFYFGALVAAAYAFGLLAVRREKRLRAALGLAAIYPIAFVLAAAQILPGIDAAAESVRGGGIPYGFAAMFSFPPENAATFLVPWLFGKLSDGWYWGRCYLWEMNVFAGLGLTLLALYGLAGLGARAWRWVAMLAFVYLLALGSHTPLHKFLYDFLPGFNSFRGSSKFVFFGGMFIALLSGFGVQKLMADRRPQAWVAAGAAVMAVLLAVFSCWLNTAAGGAWFHAAVLAARNTGEIFYPGQMAENPADLAVALEGATGALQESALMLALMAVLWVGVRHFARAKWILLAAAVAEVFVAAKSTTVTFPFQAATFAPFRETLKRLPGDFRILNLFSPNANMMLVREGVWGYDPSRLRRYSRLMLASQGVNPDEVNVPLPLNRPHPVLDLFRCQYAAFPARGGIDLMPVGKPFPRFFVVGDYEVHPAEEILAALTNPAFDLHKKALLETEPNPRPRASDHAPKASVRIMKVTVNSYDLEVAVDADALLLVTDTYSRDWRASPLPGNAQLSYDLLPANYAMRAVPLIAGNHRIRLEYRPAGLLPGLLLSGLGLLGVGIYFFHPWLLRRIGFDDDPAEGVR
ncbi:MAG: hypothetical protein WCH98_15105 [Verrucomicrobiota bacterium]